MDILIKILSVFLLSSEEIVFGIPLGFALGLDPIVIGITAALGATAGGWLVVLVGHQIGAWFVRLRTKLRERLARSQEADLQRVDLPADVFHRTWRKFRDWLLRERKPKPEGTSKRHQTIHRIWEKYGVAGVGLLAPWVVGVPVGAAIGVALGAERKSLMFWLAAGSILGSAGMTAAGALGLAGFEAIAH